MRQFFRSFLIRLNELRLTREISHRPCTFIYTAAVSNSATRGVCRQYIMYAGVFVLAFTRVRYVLRPPAGREPRENGERVIVFIQVISIWYNTNRYTRDEPEMGFVSSARNCGWITRGVVIIIDS